MWVNGKFFANNDSNILRNDVEILDMPTMDFSSDCEQASCDLCYVDGFLPTMNFHPKPVQKTNTDSSGVEILDLPEMTF